jgi:hypothetical protein
MLDDKNDDRANDGDEHAPDIQATDPSRAEEVEEVSTHEGPDDARSVPERELRELPTGDRAESGRLRNSSREEQ